MPPQNDPAANPGTVGDGENITTGASPTGQGQPDQVVSPPPAPVATPSTDVQPSVVAASQPVAPEMGAAASAGVSGMDISTSAEVTTAQASPQSVPQPNPVPAVGAPAPNISSPQPVVAAPPDPGVAPVSPPPEHTTVVHAGGVDTLPAPADGGNKKKLLIFGIVGVAVLGIIIAAIIFLPKLLGGIKLEAYSTDDYSLQVPAEYEKNTEDEGYTAFDEKDDKKTRSRVIVAYEKFPKELTESQKDMLFTTAKSALQGQIDQSFTGSEHKAKNPSLEETEYKGEKALGLGNFI